MPYPMLLGDDATAKRHGIGNLPDTFLIDRRRRVAAKDGVEANIKAILSKH